MNLVRAFLPTQDFDRSKAFYEALGFEKVLDSEVAIFKSDSGGFILQRHWAQGWAENCMMQLMVDDLDAWWTRIQALDLPAKFGTRLRGPQMEPWGLREVHVIDPAGVLWHVAERRPGAPQD